jgi:amino acid permease
MGVFFPAAPPAKTLPAASAAANARLTARFELLLFNITILLTRHYSSLMSRSYKSFVKSPQIFRQLVWSGLHLTKPTVLY